MNNFIRDVGRKWPRWRQMTLLAKMMPTSASRFNPFFTFTEAIFDPCKFPYPVIKGFLNITYGEFIHNPYTAKTKCRTIWNKYSQKRNIGASVPISTFMYLWGNYIFPRWVCLFCRRKYVDWSWEYINRSKTHECGNWGWGRAIPEKEYINGIAVAVSYIYLVIMLLLAKAIG